MSDDENVKRVRMPKDDQVLGQVEGAVGGGKYQVRCQDGNMRLCRIPGSKKRDIWLRDGDIVLIEPWKVQGDERGDIVWRYRKAQAQWLKKKGILKL